MSSKVDINTPSRNYVAEYWIRLRISTQNVAYVFGEYRPVSGFLLRPIPKYKYLSFLHQNKI